ncbi:Di-copper centre-containing protein [Aspergillus sclerotioniger CBS 115572]|uniref:tyrosinase n=1 Tax=Aspergillus sclerotioniger CBS 115572 TaxID=1450535 RepID=A0A317XE17_9EURO|nr:Di-copper centre-containing protein [Aspergillus sclerotioniger CBS 115572]PWY95168.1 Di-copper centre-containing protein [Aspergillus sclerotioniger CBS 115572]
MTFIITGVPRECDQPEGPPLRRDIDNWYLEQTVPNSKRIQLTLFVEALTALQNTDYTEKLSYFRLAGIHSAPWTEWDGVPGRPYNPDHPDNEGRGFCVHGNYTFPTWHRAYLALYEQVLSEAMVRFINQSHVPAQVKEEWLNEAKQWRLPYWDFARFPKHQLDGPEADELRLPILATMPMVTVSVIGRQDKIRRPNPLYRFCMDIPMGELQHPYQITAQLSSGVTLPFDQCQSTTKYGLMAGYNEGIWSDGGQDWQRANLALNEHPWYQNMYAWDLLPTLQDSTFRLLTTPLENWGIFSSTKWHDDRDIDILPTNYMNIEAIHNNVHNWVGGFMFRRPEQHDLKLWGVGHMSNVPVAAFDPIFWLHHCNIDRLTAIWQSLNPDKWFDDDSQQSRNDDLKPFHKDNNAFYKSDDVRYWRKLNYDYAITQIPGNDLCQVRNPEEIEDDVRRLYGRRREDLYRGKQEYVLTIKYNRHALKGSPFQINIFLGPVDPKDFYDSRSRNFVGSVFNFSAAINSTNCGNCIQQEKEGIMSVAQLPATLAVHHHKHNTDNKDKKIPTPHYVVVNSQGQAVDLSDNVQVALYEGEEPREGEPPGNGHKGKYSKVSDGKPAEVDKRYRVKDIGRPATPSFTPSTSSSSSLSSSPLVMVARDE